MTLGQSCPIRSWREPCAFSCQKLATGAPVGSSRRSEARELGRIWTRTVNQHVERELVAAKAKSSNGAQSLKEMEIMICSGKAPGLRLKRYVIIDRQETKRDGTNLMS
jgi:hypothetical protein